MQNAEAASPIKLALICYPYSPSRDTGRGHDRYVIELLENVAANERDIELKVIDPGLSKSMVAGFSKLHRLFLELLTARADVYHAISPVGGAVAVLLGKGPLVVTIHDVIPFNLSGFDHSWKYSIWRQCIRLCLKKSAAIVVPYQVTKDELVSRLKTPAEKVHVVNYGVDHGVYHQRPELLRAKNKILYIGEVSRSKGVDTLIRAFRLVKDRVPEAELIIGGKRSKDQPELEELAKSLGASDISFKGFIAEEELATHYATTSVMVFPSRCGFGLSTLEAMACATPVIAVAALDAPEFIADAGLLVEPDDAEGLASSLVRVLTETGLAEQLSTKGAARSKLFSWARMARETARVCVNLVRKPVVSGEAAEARS